MSSSMSSTDHNDHNDNMTVSTPPSSPPSFLYKSPNRGRKRSSGGMLRGYLTTIQATQSAIEAADWSELSDDELERTKIEHAHVAHKVELYTQRLQTETSVREAMQVVYSDSNAELELSAAKMDELERTLSRHYRRLLSLRTKLLHHNAAVLLKFIHHNNLLHTQPTPSQLDSRHFHANNDRAWLSGSEGVIGSNDQPSKGKAVEKTKTIETINETVVAERVNEATHAILSENETLQQRLREHLEESHGRTTQLDSAVQESAHYKQLLNDAHSAHTQQSQHSTNLQSRLQSLLEDFSQVVTMRDGMTSNLDGLCGVLDTHNVAYKRHPHNPLDTFTSAIASIEAQLMLNKENTSASEQMTYLTQEKNTMRQRFDYYENQMQQLSDVIANQRLDMETQKQQWSSVAGEQKQRVTSLEEELGEANMRIRSMEADVAFYKDSNAAYERELKSREDSRHSSGVSVSEEKLSMQALKGLWKVLPNSSHRPPGQRLIDASSAALAQSDIDKLKQVLERWKERSFEKYDLRAFVGCVRTLIDDNRFFIERILHNAETANLYKGNAEKAHKLALDFKNALEGYKKQVLDLQNSLSQAARRDAEIRKDREELREQLTVAQRDLVTQQQGGEVEKLRKSIVNREDEIQAFKQLQMDKSLGMLDELNSLQIEVADLRQKLRQK